MEIETRKYHTSENGLVIDQGMNVDEWLECGYTLWRAYTGLRWCIGDWLIYGEFKFGEDYAQGEAITGYRPQTLRNLASIARAFPDKEYRRRYPVSMAIYAELAPVDIPIEQKSEFLQAAADNKLSREDVRAAIKSWRGEPESVKPWSLVLVPDNPEVTIRLPNDYVGQEVTITVRVNGNGTGL